MTKQLVAVAGNRVMGRVDQGRDGRLTFTYDADWGTSDGAYPLSLSMPLVVAEHAHAPIAAFLAGLLPDNETVLARWGRKFGVSPGNPFALLTKVGEECAGAVQFVLPERVVALVAGRPGMTHWLNAADVAARLRVLATDIAAWRIAGDAGQFSLAGAKPKTALLYRDGRWGVPSGRTPTTHILKPPTPDFDGIAENEHLCLRFAHALGLSVAESRVERFEDQIAIVVERFDRVIEGRRITRIHQEDGCQALGVPPNRKYENDGGPDIAKLVELLRTYSGDARTDVAAFVDALIVNWLIAGTDAHAKNYAILLGAGGRARLAPLYDLTSALPYSDSLDPRKNKFAMQIDGEYLIRRVGPTHWASLARQIRFDPDDLHEHLLEMVARTPDTITDVCRTAVRDGLDHPIVARLSDAIVARANDLKARLQTATARRP